MAVPNPPSSKLSAWLTRSILVTQVEEPVNYARSLKWALTVILAAASVIDSVSYTIVLPALPQMAAEFHVPNTLVTLSSTLCYIGPAIMPLYWGSLAESCGRRITYIAALLLFILCSALGGVMQDITGVIVMRILASFCACATTVTGGGVVADLWEVRTRGFAMSIYFLGPLTGPAIGPLLGGALESAWSWRAGQWFLTAYAATILTLIVLLLPETLREKASPDKDVDQLSDSRSESDDTCIENSEQGAKTNGCKTFFNKISRIFLKPILALSFLRFPIVFFVVYLASTSFISVVMTSISIQHAFAHQPYHYKSLIIGLLYLPMPMGMVPASLIGGKWSDRIMDRVARSRAKEELESGEKAVDGQGQSGKGAVVHFPEDRIRENAWLSIILLPGALLFYGWTVQHGLFWVIPMIPWCLIGLAAGLILSLAAAMLTEFVPPRSATMVALNSLGRNLGGAVAGSATQPIINAIGCGWLLTIIAVLVTGNFAVVFALRKFGRRWREDLDQKMGWARLPEVTNTSDCGSSDSASSVETAVAVEMKNGGKVVEVESGSASQS